MDAPSDRRATAPGAAREGAGGATARGAARERAGGATARGAARERAGGATARGAAREEAPADAPARGTAPGGSTRGADHATRGDAVDAIEARWRELRPDVDPAPVAIVGRLLRTAAITTRRSDEALAAHGLTRGEFDLLSALRRAGAAQRPSDLTTVSLVSPAATTKRLKALTARGWSSGRPTPTTAAAR